MMQRIMITIQKGQLSNYQIRSLEHILHRHYQKYIAKTKVQVLWNLVPIGDGFKDYKQKQPTIISMGCPVNFSQQKRVAMFKSCEEDWMSLTGENPDNLVIAILEQPVFEAFFKRTSQQLTGLGKLNFYAHLLFNVFRSKLAYGYRSFNSSL